MPKHTVKEKKKNKAKSLLSRIMTFGARDKAEKAPVEKFLSNKKKRQFKLKR